VSSRLYLRLAGVLLLLLILLGSLAGLLTAHTARLYFEEVHQKLNLLVAHRIAKGVELGPDGKLSPQDESMLFMNGMNLNPSLEIYLLSPEGEVLQYDSSAEGRVMRRRVDLAPVREMQRRMRSIQVPEGRFAPEGIAHFRILRGDDPRHSSRRKIFSAAPVGDPDQPQAWIYAILGGQEYDTIASESGFGYILRGSAWILGISVALAAAAGLLAFHALTRPLGRLRGAIERFHGGDVEARARLGSQDEIGRLGAAFDRMADTILEQMQSIRERDELRRELVANISHDLRTPVASLQGYLETALGKDSSLTGEERRLFLETALRNATRLARLVDELFELARFDAGEIQPKMEVFALDDLVQDLVQKFRLRSEERGIQIRMSCPRELPPVRGDLGLIERVLDNLLENALRYTPRGGRIRVHLQEKGSQVEVRVADTGQGIPASEIPRIFDRFYRVEKSRSDGSGGAGLGLAIAKRILDLHSSPVRVHSRVGVGTWFAFSLAVSDPPLPMES